MSNDNLTAAIEGAIDYSLADEGMVDPELIAQYLRREWGVALSVHDFEPVERKLIPLINAAPGKLVRAYVGDTTVLGRVDKIWFEAVDLEGKGNSAVTVRGASVVQCEVLEG